MDDDDCPKRGWVQSWHLGKRAQFRNPVIEYDKPNMGSCIARATFEPLNGMERPTKCAAPLALVSNTMLTHGFAPLTRGSPWANL